MCHRALLQLGLTAALFTFAVSPAYAWPFLPNSYAPICTAPGDQLVTEVLDDGAGGSYVAWQDARTSGTTGWDAYLVRVDAQGNRSSGWPSNGFPVASVFGDQVKLQAVPDGAGGVLLTWQDRRSGWWRAYAQHVLATGVPAPGWPANGKELLVQLNDCTGPSICPDGAGGAYVFFEDATSVLDHDVMLARVSAAGVPAVSPLANTTDWESAPTCTADGAGGAFFTYQVPLSSGGVRIEIGHISAAGAIVQQALSSSARSTLPRMMLDAAGRCVVAWADSMASSGDALRIARFDAALAPDPTWGGGSPITLGGAGVPGELLTSWDLVPNRPNGMYVAWEHAGLAGALDVNWIRLDANGAPAAGWPSAGYAWAPGGIGVGSASRPRLAPDGKGGIYVVCEYVVAGGSHDLGMFHDDSTGATPPNWSNESPRALCQMPDDQSHAAALGDGSGGMMAFWSDRRDGIQYDVVGQHVEYLGWFGNPAPSNVKVKDVPADQGGRIRITWNASPHDLPGIGAVTSYRVWRLDPAPNSVWTLAAVVPIDFQASYACTLSTVVDSVASGNPQTTIAVRSQNDDTGASWEATPQYGYSVDNLAPVAPTGLVGSWTPSVTTLSWDANNVEPDFAGYYLYAATDTTSAPRVAARVATLTQTHITLPNGAQCIYKVTAFDVHGNEGPFDAVVPEGVADGVESPAPVLALLPPSPNPTAGATVVRFSLSRPGPVSLVVLDAQGRRIRNLVDEVMSAGPHVVTWRTSSETGRTAPPGVWFVRLEAEDRTLTRRLVSLR